eukprot:2228712-Prymnesium_polylepis.1
MSSAEKRHRTNAFQVFAAAEPYEGQNEPPCVLHPTRLEVLGLFVGDAVLIKAGRKGRRQDGGSWPRCIVQESSIVAEDGMLLSAATRTDLNLEVGALATVRFLHSAQTVLVPCPAEDVGRVIGRGGSVLKQVQRESGARTLRVNTDSNGISVVEIKGTSGQVKDAEIAINSILSAPRTVTTPATPAREEPETGPCGDDGATNIGDLAALSVGSSATAEQAEAEAAKKAAAKKAAKKVNKQAGLEARAQASGLTVVEQKDAEAMARQQAEAEKWAKQPDWKKDWKLRKAEKKAVEKDQFEARARASGVTHREQKEADARARMLANAQKWGLDLTEEALSAAFVT